MTTFNDNGDHISEPLSPMMMHRRESGLSMFFSEYSVEAEREQHDQEEKALKSAAADLDPIEFVQPKKSPQDGMKRATDPLDDIEFALPMPRRFGTVGNDTLGALPLFTVPDDFKFEANPVPVQGTLGGDQQLPMRLNSPTMDVVAQNNKITGPTILNMAKETEGKIDDVPIQNVQSRITGSTVEPESRTSAEITLLVPRSMPVIEP